MNPSESRDPAALARANERSLERLRIELVLSCDDDREPVIDELLRRGAAAIGAGLRVNRSSPLQSRRWSRSRCASAPLIR